MRRPESGFPDAGGCLENDRNLKLSEDPCTDLRTAQVLLGHGDLETRAKYLYLSEKNLRAVIAKLARQRPSLAWIN